jgi:serine/threonine protein kinase
MSNVASASENEVFSPPVPGDIITGHNSHYIIGSLINAGNFGTVYECRDEWGNALAAKVIRPLNRSYDEVRLEWSRELNKLLHLRHPNVTYLYDACEHRDTFYLIMERCSYPLKDLINIQSGNGETWLPYVARDLLQALNFIHNSGFVHKDLHAGNVFVAHTFEKMVPDKKPIWSFKVGDLGISNLEADIDVFNTILAQWMLPPEFLNPTDFGVVGKSIDIYHVGLLLLGLLLGKVPQFSKEEILEGKPRQLAESLDTPFAPAVAAALRRHVSQRPISALELWRSIKKSSPVPI